MQSPPAVTQSAELADGAGIPEPHPQKVMPLVHTSRGIVMQRASTR